ncbi:hypothetical protein GXW82_04030 [Streptacidiphilus sp. 4-A2]|nr:hypothetical protein [Streptacidiphilus sp. 4-A2]
MGKLPLRRPGKLAGTAGLAVVLAAGGATAYAATGSGSTGTASAGTVSAGTVSTTSSAHLGTTTAVTRAGHRLALRGLHGQVTVRNAKTGQFVTREWQRGLITAVSGTTLTVRSADGTTWTWTAAANAKVTRDGAKISESTLKTGDPVLVAGKQAGSTNDATRIFAPTSAQIAKLKANAAQEFTDS